MAFLIVQFEMDKRSWSTVRRRKSSASAREMIDREA
jgi:hypothetical protein